MHSSLADGREAELHAEGTLGSPGEKGLQFLSKELNSSFIPGTYDISSRTGQEWKGPPPTSLRGGG